MRHFGDVDLMIVNGFTRPGIFLTLLFRLTSLIAVFPASGLLAAENPAELIDSIAPDIPVDGYTEWAKQAGISQSLEFTGGAVDHFASFQLATGNFKDAMTFERIAPWDG